MRLGPLLRKFIMLRRYHALRPMMCCRPSSGEIVALWAECVHAGFMTLADYFKHVERDDRGKVWVVYEIEEGKAVIRLLSEPTDAHIVIDPWEFREYICLLPTIEMPWQKKASEPT